MAIEIIKRDIREATRCSSRSRVRPAALLGEMPGVTGLTA
jgi:hypothetical protein